MALYVPGGNPALKAPRSYGSKPITPISSTVTGTPSPDSPATLTPLEPPAIPGAAKQIGPLWSLPDGAKDTYDGETGVLVRRVGKLVLDGTENWRLGGEAEGSNTLDISWYITGVEDKKFFKSKSAISSHFEYRTGGGDKPGFIIWGGLQGLDLLIPKNILSQVTVDAAKAWLAAQAAAGTPVVVLYELAQPTVERIIYTGPIATTATEILAPSWEGHTTVTGTPSPTSPAMITGTPFAATATGPDGQTRSVDLGFTGYSLPDGTRDTYDGVRGDFVQRVGRLILDGTEIWYKNGEFFCLENSQFIVNSYVICTHFPYKYNQLGQDGIFIANASVLFVNYHSGVDGIENYKSWLAAQATAGTPVTVYYALAKPIAYNRKVDITAFDGQTTVTGADAVEVIEGRVLRVADCLPFEIVRSNPNLLDNWYLIDPVNQRNQIEYTQNGYCIDRWFNRFCKSIKLTDNGILVDTTCIKDGEGSGLNYGLDLPKSLMGKVVTLSALIEENTVGHCRFGICRSANVNYNSNPVFGKNIAEETGLVSVTGELPLSMGGYNKLILEFYFVVQPAKNIKIKAVKLELGTEQTLARKIGDQWVLNDPPPDYGQELLKCQRYFRIAKGRFPGALVENEKRIYVSIPSPVEMRANPTVTVKSNGTYAYNGVKQIQSWNTTGNVSSGEIGVIASVGTNGTNIESVVVSDAELWLSAEL